MKATVKQVVECYKALGEAKVTKLEESEVIKVIKIRKALRPIANEFDEFLKDCQEKFKPENWNELQEKLQNWKQVGEEERVGINKDMNSYKDKLEAAVNDEFAKEVEINIETLKEDSARKILLENSWPIGKLDEIEIVL